MKYSDLLKARRKTGDLPTLATKPLNERQAEWDRAGRCIECGQTPQLPDSRICWTCLSQFTMDDIRNEIASLRRKILDSQKK